MKLNIYNITILYYISITYRNYYRKNIESPNRVKIIRDFENLLNYEFIDNNLNNERLNKVNLSDNKLFSKLQEIIFNKINNYSNLEDLKNKLLNDIKYKVKKNFNIYDVANLWCMEKYDLI